MDAKKFTKELTKIVRNFDTRAKDYGEIIEGTEIELCNGYLSLWCTVEDKHGDTACCSQEIEIFNDDLNPLQFSCNW
jgi:hypothetical protein